MERDMEEKQAGIRINKYLSEAGVSSRREADRLIQAGKVMINENVVTIVVKGNDYSKNNNNTHTYTLTYQDTRSQLSSLSINGIALEGFSKDKYDYTVSGEVPAKDQIIAEADGKDATVDIEINKKVVTITVSGSNIATDPENKHVYTLTFDYEQGIENNGTIENLKIYSINGNVFVQGYTGTVVKHFDPEFVRMCTNRKIHD